MTTEPAKVNAAYEAIDIIARTNGSALLFPVWGTDGKTCRCPKGAACGSPGKHPAVNDWDEQAHRDAQRIEKSLGNPGTPNYGITPRGRLLIMDADGPAQRAAMKGWMRAVGIETTFVVKSGREDGGMHYYFWLPEGVDPAAAPNYLWLTEDVKVLVRSAGRNGYVVGPGSVHASGKQYRVVADFDIAVIPVEALRVSRMMEPKAKAAASGEPVITIHETYELPERVTASDVRYYAIRDYAAHLYNRGLSAGEAFGLVKSELLPRFDVPLTEPEAKDRFDRSWAGITESLGPPASTPEGKERFKAEQEQKAEEEAKAIEDLSVDIFDYNAAVPDTVPWCGPFGFFGGVSMLAAPSKSGKSTLLSTFMEVRAVGGTYLGWDIEQGPQVYISEEGGQPIKQKTLRIPQGTMRVIDRSAYARSGVKTLAALLAHIAAKTLPQFGGQRAVVYIDTMSVFAGVKDENDAAAMTAALDAVIVFAQETGSLVILVHHTRKGGGTFGEGVRGSSAIFALVDHLIELRRPEHAVAGEVRRILDFTSRMFFVDPKSKLPLYTLMLVFDAATKTYDVDLTGAFGGTKDTALDGMPVDGSGDPGLDKYGLGKLWGISPVAAANKARVDLKDVLVVKRVGKSNYWWRRPPLLDLSRSGSVGERMGDIFAHKEDTDED